MAEKYYIVPNRKVAKQVMSGNAESAMQQFAETMDSDIGTYFKAVPESSLLPVVPGMDAENGTVYETGSFYNIYCIRGRKHRDGSCSWDICIELKSAPEKYMVIGRVRGSKEDAQKKCVDYVYGYSE